jgi:PAS domain S-box-containing protein
MENLLLCISKANNHLLKQHGIHDALNFCISDIGTGQDIDRCYIFKNRIDNNILKLYYEYEWCNAGVQPYLGSPELNGIPYDLFPGLYANLSRDEPMYGLVKDSDNELFKATMEMQGIKSYLFTPIFSNNSFWGWIGYDDCRNEREWIDAEVYALHTIAKNIGLRLNQDKTISKLETTLEKFDHFMSISNQGMWEWNFETNKSIYSYNWARMLGFTNDEISEDLDFWKKNVHPEDISKIVSNLENYISGKIHCYEGEARIKHKEGHYIWVKYSGLLKRNSDGTPQKIIGTHIDISELKEKEILLKLSESKFRFIAENTSDIICQHNLDGSFFYVSNSFTEILGYRPEEVINKIAFNYIHPEDCIFVKNTHDEFLRTANYQLMTYRFRKKDNTYVWLETTSKNMVDHNSVVVGLQTSSRDISERIKVGEEMKTALLKERKFNELKSKFVSMASHQFRTPLTVIYSNAEIIDIKTDNLEMNNRDSIGSITARIKNEVDRMTELMNNILIFGKQESDKIKKNIQPIDLNEFIALFIKTYFDEGRCERKIQIIIKGNKQTVFTDETLIIHVLTNLISNAFKYSIGRPDPKLIITYLKRQCKIEIIDFGIGIPEKEIQHLFTSFFRASNTSTITGSGLGLVIVKQFTEFLNGEVELTTKEGFGTTIKLIFPYQQN